MHMADALISPAVGGAMWVATGALIAHSAQRLKHENDDRRVPLMGVLGAFVFAAMMINFAIPGTGSSGHLAGGMLLSILLGPHAAFIVMASILAVQALFFADGGLLALGCNIFNLGFFPCFVAYPLIYKPIAGAQPTRRRIAAASTVSAVAALQMGSLGVVIETAASGISDLPLKAFLLFMQPIHLAIGIVEGFITAAVVNFIWQARPEWSMTVAPAAGVSFRKMIVGLGVSAIVMAGMLSWFASSRPDGLEWSLSKAATEIELPGAGIHAAAEYVQSLVSFLPDYNFRAGASAETDAGAAGTSLAGLVGCALTLGLIGLIGLALKSRRLEGS